MLRELYRYRFDHLPPTEVEASLSLALVAAESLHGQAQVRLDARHAFSAERRRCVIDASTPVGLALNRLFIGFLNFEFPADSFEVERLAAAKQSAGDDDFDLNTARTDARCAAA